MKSYNYWRAGQLERLIKHLTCLSKTCNNQLDKTEPRFMILSQEAV